MKRPRRSRSLLYALYANAALLLVIVGLLLTRGGSASLLPSAYGAGQVPPIAGGGGLFLMPGQLSMNSWGCYIMDIDAQTLSAYQYYPADKQLKLVSSRGFHYDRLLKNFNTSPSWMEIQKLTELEKQSVRSADESAPPLSPEAPRTDQ